MKIFLNDRVILFGDHLNETITDHDLIAEFVSPEQLKEVWERFVRYDKFDRLLLPETAIGTFFTMFKEVNAAGGLVKNEKGEMLFIHRNGRWDMPKGKLDSAETPQLAAIREVKEETGLMEVELLDEICCTYHIYSAKEKWYLKRTWWYLMWADSGQPLTPQASEGIYLVKWTPPKAVHCILTHTYASIREMLLEILF